MSTNENIIIRRQESTHVFVFVRERTTEFKANAKMMCGNGERG